MRCGSPALRFSCRELALRGLLLPVLAVAGCHSNGSHRIEIADVGRFDFELEVPGTAEAPPDGLSGIIHLGGDEYLVASDASAFLHRLEIKLDPASGKVNSIAARGGLQLRSEDGTPMEGAQLKDREDLALGSGGAQVIVANERCGPAPPLPCLEIHDLATGRLIKRAGPGDGGQLAIFAKVELNMGFEAIASIPGNEGYWVAAERALEIDGGPATADGGSPVRLQRLSAALSGTGQFVYVTDRISRPVRAGEPLAQFSGSRLVGMLALAGGELVCLENILQGDAAGSAETRMRIYQVSISSATDVSEGEFASGLKGRDYQPVDKRLLIELVFAGTASNYEGMSLGPRLENGGYSLLLVRDNGTGSDQSIHALRLRLY